MWDEVEETAEAEHDLGVWNIHLKVAMVYDIGSVTFPFLWVQSYYLSIPGKIFKYRQMIPGLRRYPGEGNGNLLWYSCLENPMNKGAWRATVHGVEESWTWLSMHTYTQILCFIVLHRHCVTAVTSSEWMWG